jgi:hypothetical protein
MRTYTQTAPDIRGIFEDVVSVVETNILTDTDLSVYIPRVSFKCETFTELVNRLTIEGEVQSMEESRYPLVSVIRNYDVTWRDGEPSAEFTIIIVTPSDKDVPSEQREVIYYDRILRPIYAELMSTIKDSSYFLRVGKMAEHKYAESFKFGDSTPNGNDGYRLPDIVDAIIITGLRLQINADTCFGQIKTPVVSVGYLNNIVGMEGSLTDSGARLRITSAQYINNRFGDAAPRVYSMYTEHDDASVVVSVGVFSNITNGGSQSGTYYGYFECDDTKGFASRLFFAYELNAGSVKRVITSNLMNLTGFTLTALEDYPFTLVTRTIYPSNLISYINMSHVGDELYSQTFASPVPDTLQISNTIHAQVLSPSANPIPVEYYAVVDGEDLSSIAYYLIN